MIDDMKLNKDQIRALNSNPNRTQSAIIGRDYRWPNAEMPFEISKSIQDPEYRKLILDTIAYLNRRFGGCFYIR